MLTWAAPFNISCFLDNQDYRPEPIRFQEAPQAKGPARAGPAFECLLAVGAVESFTAAAGHAFSGLSTWAAQRQEWLFGHFAYDLATETEPGPAIVAAGPGIVHQPGSLAPAADPAARPNPPAPAADPIGFPDLFFFVPEIVLQLSQDSIRIGALHSDPAALWAEISQTSPADAPPPASTRFTPRLTRDEYLATITALQRHILLGDCYEINFCQEFYAQPAALDPLAAWQALSQASPNPFSAYYRLDERFLLCASPERFLSKTGSTLLSQPIKGTAARALYDPAADLRLARELYLSEKDRVENVMVVDLVRNDLSKISLPGSVQVSELFGIYPFPQVHQMISTITGELLPELHWSQAIAATFPMGSMTGAPKNRVVQLIAQYERSHRGIFSGAVGYVTPEGDFDFNVVIRSLLYNREKQYLSYLVGSGITFNSDPAAEYEECLLKAQGLLKVFN